MDIRQLTYFVRVIELRSFTKAAEVLRISQPAIGEQIKNLEAELGAVLLTRHSRGIEPTEAGRILFNRARAILAQVSEARAAVREFETGLRGDVTFGLTPGLGDSVAVSAIERCAREFPGISINVVEDLSSSLVKRIAGGEEALSFAVVSGFDLAQNANLHRQSLLEEELYAVSAPGLTGEGDEKIAFRDLARHRLILLGNGSPARQGMKANLHRIAEQEGIELSIAYEIQAVSVAKRLAEQGVGVAILPFDTVRDLVAQRRVRAQAIAEPAVTRELNLIWNTSRPPTGPEESVRNALVQTIAARRESIGH